MAWPEGKPIRLGILGLGPAGATLVPYVDAEPGFELAAVCDVQPEMLARYTNRQGLRRHATLAALCADDAVDAVYVATPTWMHAEHAIALARAGKHLIVEKPIATAPDEARAMIAAAEGAGVTLLIGHSQSFEATVRIMRAVIEGGTLGRLRAVNGLAYTDWMFKPRQAAEFDRTQGGGVVYRQAAHQVDILRFLARGSPSMVHASVGQWDADRPGDGSYSAFLTFTDGVVATLFYSGYDHFSSMELSFGLGPNGNPEQGSLGASRRLTRALSAGDEAATKYSPAGEARRAGMSNPGKLAAFGLFIVSCEHGDMRVVADGVQVYGDDGPWVIPVDGLPLGRTALLRELATALSGQATIHDGHWGLANLEVCCAILESAERGAPVWREAVQGGAAATDREAAAWVRACAAQRAVG